MNLRMDANVLRVYEMCRMKALERTSIYRYPRFLVKTLGMPVANEIVLRAILLRAAREMMRGIRL